MKKLILGLCLLSTLSFSLVSCRNYNAENGTYGYYNGRTNDRENNRNVAGDTRDRLMRNYDRAKNNVKNAVDNVKNDVKDMMREFFIGGALFIKAFPLSKSAQMELT